MAIQGTGGPPNVTGLGGRAAWPRSWASAGLGAGGIALGLYLFYAPVYHVRHLGEPLGFDAPWYIWHAQFAAARGIGPLDTASRPGTSLLEAVAGSVTRLSQPILAVVVPIVMVAVFALAMGAFAIAVLGRSPRRFAVATAVTGVLLGATRLVSENVATVVFLAIGVVALTALTRRAVGERGLAGCVVLLVAAGVAHWLFLAVLLAALAVAAALRLPTAMRARREGAGWLETDAGLLAAVVASVAALVAAVIALVLRAPFSTIELTEPPSRLPQKLRTDLVRLWLPLTMPAAALGAIAISRRDRATVPAPAGDPHRARSPGLAVLAGWAIVCGLGLLYGLLTKNLPPHRFLELALAVPGAILLAEGVEWVASRAQMKAEARRAGGAPERVGFPVGSRWPRCVGGTVALFGIGLLALPGLATWYRTGPGVWIDRTGLQQATIASAYVRSLPAGRSFVFLVSQQGTAGTLSPALDERTIRMAIPPNRQQDMHLYAGDVADLLAGRQTLSDDPYMNDAVRLYWDDVRRVLPQRPPILVVQAFAREQFDRALSSGWKLVAPGVAILARGTDPPAPATLPSTPLPRSVPYPPAGVLWAVIILLMLFCSGLGWSRLMFGPRADRLGILGAAPAVGAAALILAALVPARAGVGMGGAAGVVTVVVVAGAGWLFAWRDARRRAGG